MSKWHLEPRTWLPNRGQRISSGQAFGLALIGFLKRTGPFLVQGVINQTVRVMNGLLPRSGRSLRLSSPTVISSTRWMRQPMCPPFTTCLANVFLQGGEVSPENMKQWWTVSINQNRICSHDTLDSIKQTVFVQCTVIYVLFITSRLHLNRSTHVA